MRGYPKVSNYIVTIQVINYSWLLISIFKPYVKMFITKGQCAWVRKKYISTHQRLNKEYLRKNDRDWFEKWLVGITDGEGTFGFYNQKERWVV